MKKFLFLLATLFCFGLFSVGYANGNDIAPATSQSKDVKVNAAFQQAYGYFQSGYDKIDNGDVTDKRNNRDAAKAIEFFEKAQYLMEKNFSGIDFKDDNSKIFMEQLYTNLGIAYTRVTNYEKAISVFNKGLALEGIDSLPEYKAYLIYDIGYSISRMGEYTESIAKYKEALKIFPELDVAKENISFLGLLKESISWMYENGLTRFSIPTAFGYEQEVSREQASKFFVEFSKKYLDIPQSDNSCTFKDLKTADPTLQSYIISACKMNILRGFHGLFSPKDKLTYGQLVTVISRMLDGTEFDADTTNFQEDHLNNLYEKGILDDSQLEIDADSIAKRSDIAIMLHDTHIYLIGTGKSSTATTGDNTTSETSPCADSGAIDQGILLLQATGEFSNSMRYSYSGNQIYYQDQLLSGIDSQTFTVFDSFFGGDYAVDKNHVYYNGEIVNGADPKSFVVVDHPYCQYDAHHVFIDEKMASCTGEANDKGILLLPLKGKLSNPSYTYSDSKIYYKFDSESSNILVSGTDNQTFAVFDGGSYQSQYAVDKNHVYYQGQILNGAVPKSFVVSDWYEHDAYHIYRDGELLFSCK